ncbi:MAG: stress response translation initiation inhibitor YciH, partial [Euryarchaeota archaeon]|nr:stress response translation initiation inhibitor YciH [Euryarchaeota archaeon]
MAGICNLCGLPDELCICQEIAKEQQKAIISTVRRRYGKMVTMVEGIEDSAIDIGKLAKLLKSACASGGTVKGRTIELQGEHKKRVAKVLEQNGYQVEVSNAYSHGGTPLNIQAIANVKVSTDPEIRNNAIERFLGHHQDEIVQVAKENLEGNLRSVLAQLTPEQVNEDRLRFAEQIADDVGSDMRRLGLQLDTLKIQSVSDDVDYLNSISRRRVAQIVRDAEIAEAEAIGQAERVEAEMEEVAEVVRT